MSSDHQETHRQDSSIDIVPGCDLFQRSLHSCSEQRKILRHALINPPEHGRVETLQASVRVEHTRDKVRATQTPWIFSRVKCLSSAPEKKRAFQHGQTTFCCVRRNSHEQSPCVQSPGVQSVLSHVPSVASHHHRLFPCSKFIDLPSAGASFPPKVVGHPRKAHVHFSLPRSDTSLWKDFLS